MSNRQWCRKDLGLSGINPERFVYFQWRVPIGIVLAYRIIVALYCVGWLVTSIIFLKTSRYPDILVNGTYGKQYAFLAMWTYLVLCVYFVLHAIVCLIHICKRDVKICDVPAAGTYTQLLNEGGGIEPNTRPLVAGLHKIVWVFYNISATTSIMVTIVFATLLYPGVTHSGIGFCVSFHLHAVTSVLFVIETLLTAVPVRIMHFIHPCLYGLLFVTSNCIYYRYDRKLYLEIDWSDPYRTVFVTLGVWFSLILIHMFLFLIYRLRVYIFDKCTPIQD